MTALSARKSTVLALTEAGIEDAAFEAAELLCFVLHTDRAGLLCAPERELTKVEEQTLTSLINRRITHEPLQYLLGEWEFYGLAIMTAPYALIPRQDTETLVEEALRLAREHGCQTALDLCCGTGCIAAALAKCGGLTVTATDLDPRCALLAKHNAEKNGVSITAVSGDLFAPVSGRFDLIATNPPYIPNGELSSLQREVQYEPRLALAGGEDGLDFYRRIRKDVEAHLSPGGTLLMEAGRGQAEALRRLFPGAYSICDLSGIERVTVWRMPE